MKSIDIRSNRHVINGRQNLSGVLLFLLLSMPSGLAEPIPDDLNRQLREILARHHFTVVRANFHFKCLNPLRRGPDP